MKDFIIVGCGRFGRSVATSLFNMNKNVIVIDKNEKTVQKISDEVTCAVQGDATDQNTLISLGVNNFDAAVVSTASDIESSTIITLGLKNLGVKYIIAKARNPTHAKILSSVGADRIVFPEKDMGKRIARNLIYTNLLDFIELSAEYGIMELISLDEWHGKTLSDLNFSSKYYVNVMAIKTGSSIKITLSSDDIIHKDDILVVVGHNKDLKKLQK